MFRGRRRQLAPSGWSFLITHVREYKFLTFQAMGFSTDGVCTPGYEVTKCGRRLFFFAIYICQNFKNMGGGLTPLCDLKGGRSRKFFKGCFYLFRICAFKNGPQNFLNRKIFLFLGQVQILVVVKNGVYLVKWDFGGPKLAKVGQKGEQQ